MGIAREAEQLATAQSGLTHSTWANSCFCSHRAQPCQVAASRCTGWSWGATWTMGGGGSGSRHCGAELHTAACNRPAHPTLACVCLDGAMKINATHLLKTRPSCSCPSSTTWDMCACVHVRVCGYVCLCVKAGDCGVEIRTRQLSSWKAGCTCTLNLLPTDPAQLGFRSTYISATHHLSLLSVICS